MLLREYTIKRWFLISPLLTNVSALPGETWNPEMVFSVPYLENDGDSAFYIVDTHQPVLIILCRQSGHVIKYSVQMLFLI